MKKTEIVKVSGREVIDSRGNPTVEATVTLADGTVSSAIVPSGASTGKYEMLEMRDGGKRYGGKGTKNAVKHVNTSIAKVVTGLNARDIYSVDKAMISADGTDNKSKFGANAILAVSIACAKAAARSKNIPLYEFIGGVSGTTLPVPMMNIINGGAHSKNNLDIQEFMIMPIGAPNFAEAVRWCCEIYHTLAACLNKRSLSTAVGDEGGFAPNLSSNEDAVRIIVEAVNLAGYDIGKDVYIALDAAASEWKKDEKSDYVMPKSGRMFSASGLVDYWSDLCDKYPIFSIEDGMGEDDFDGWRSLTERLGKRIRLVGDDLFVTNKKRLEIGAARACGNSILIKPNQIGTITETIETVKFAKRVGYNAVMSHRSGETEDTTIADLAVALNIAQIKTGAPCRGERTAKYNRLIRIEEALGSAAVYGRDNLI